MRDFSNEEEAFGRAKKFDAVPSTRIVLPAM